MFYFRPAIYILVIIIRVGERIVIIINMNKETEETFLIGV